MNAKKTYNVLSKHLNLNEDQEELLHKIISGLLPHENYDSLAAQSVQKELFSLLPIEEVYGVDYIFYKIFLNINSIMNTYNTGTVRLTKENFEACVRHYIGNVIRKPEFDPKLYFGQFGKDYNLANIEEVEQAIDLTYSMAMDAYDEMFEMKVSSGEANTLLIPLRESLKTALLERSMNIEAEVLKNSVVINGTSYSGPDDALYIRNLQQAEIESRFSSDTNLAERSLYAKDYVTVQDYKKTNPNIIKPIAYLGYDPIDQIFPLRTQDIIALIADEGVGKTKLTIDWVHTLLMAGKNVAVIAGETDIDKYRTFVVLNHIYFKEKKSFSYDEYTDRQRIPHESEDELEQWNILIDGWENDLLTNPAYGKMMLYQNKSYERFYSDIKADTLRYDYDVVIVDHVAILNSNGTRTIDGYLDNEKKRIDYLYRQEDVLAKELNLCFINTVHLQNDASAKLAAGKSIGVRIAGGSSSSTKYGSLVMLLRTTEELQKQGIYVLEFKKVRDYAKPPAIALCRNGVTASHWYDPRMQHYVTGETDNITSSRIDELIGVELADEEEDSDDIELGLDI